MCGKTVHRAPKMRNLFPVAPAEGRREFTDRADKRRAMSLTTSGSQCDMAWDKAQPMADLDTMDHIVFRSDRPARFSMLLLGIFDRFGIGSAAVGVTGHELLSGGTARIR